MRDMLFGIALGKISTQLIVHYGISVRGSWCPAADHYLGVVLTGECEQINVVSNAGRA